MFKVIKKEDYHTYKTIYMSFEEYDNFYNINKSHENIKYFNIFIVFVLILNHHEFSRNTEAYLHTMTLPYSLIAAAA